MKKRTAGQRDTNRRSIKQVIAEQEARIAALEENLFLVSEVVKMQAERLEMLVQFGENTLDRFANIEAPQVKTGIVVLN